jgi:hypothetical protein
MLSSRLSEEEREEKEHVVVVVVVVVVEEEEGEENFSPSVPFSLSVLPRFKMPSVSMMESASMKADDKRYSQHSSSPRHEGGKPSGEVARGRAKNPPPIVVPAMSRAEDRTVAGASLSEEGIEDEEDVGAFGTTLMREELFDLLDVLCWLCLDGRR